MKGKRIAVPLVASGDVFAFTATFHHQLISGAPIF